MFFPLQLYVQFDVCINGVAVTFCQRVMCVTHNRDILKAAGYILTCYIFHLFNL